MRTSSPSSLHIEPVQGADGAVGLAFGGPEGGEIVLPDESLRGLMHGFARRAARPRARPGSPRARAAPGG